MTENDQQYCSVEAIVTVDERGQMVLPKDFRSRTGIKPGDKFALVSFANDDQLCCISLIRVGKLGIMIKEILHPVIAQLGE